MNKEATSPRQSISGLIQHAILAVCGWYACQLGMVAAIDQVAIEQKVREHRPQAKVLEFRVAMLTGLSHLQDITPSPHSLNRDQIVVEECGQLAWAGYGGGRPDVTVPE